MHEYHITCLPLHQRTYVICQVMYKGEDGDISYGGDNQSEPSQPLVSPSSKMFLYSSQTLFTIFQLEQLCQDTDNDLPVDYWRNLLKEQNPLPRWDVLDSDTFFCDNNDPSVQPESPNDDEFLCGLRHVDRKKVKTLLSNTLSREPRCVRNYLGTSSSGDDSIRNSNRYFLQSSRYDLRTNAESSISIAAWGRPLTHIRNLEVLSSSYVDFVDACKKLSIVKTEKKVKQDIFKPVDTSMDEKSSIVKTEKKSWFI